MSDSAVLAADPGVFSRAVGVIVSPAATFERVVQHPRPAGILLIVCVVLALATGLPQLTERGRQTALETQIATMERTGQTVTPQARAQMEQFSRFNGYVVMVLTFVMLPVVSLLFAAIYWALFNSVLGGLASFKQVLAIVTHSQVVTALGALAAVPIVLSQGIQSMTGPFNAAAFAPMLEPDSWLALYLSGLNLFTIWGLVVTAIGLGVLYRRRPFGIALALLVAYLALTAAFTSVFSTFTGR